MPGKALFSSSQAQRAQGSGHLLRPAKKSRPQVPSRASRVRVAVGTNIPRRKRPSTLGARQGLAANFRRAPARCRVFLPVLCPRGAWGLAESLEVTGSILVKVRPGRQRELGRVPRVSGPRKSLCILLLRREPHRGSRKLQSAISRKAPAPGRSGPRRRTALGRDQENAKRAAILGPPE
jgi:hypothetical protein